jgi:hypothetical protein
VGKKNREDAKGAKENEKKTQETAIFPRISLHESDFEHWLKYLLRLCLRDLRAFAVIFFAFTAENSKNYGSCGRPLPRTLNPLLYPGLLQNL